MTKYDDLTRSLLAAGGAPSEDGGVNLVYEENNDLILKEWSDSEVKDQSLITSGVKKNTDAPYLQFEDKRLVFYITESNTLKFSTYNAQDEDWEEVSLGEKDINVHPNSRLAACLAPTGILAFFQDPTGALKGITTEKGSWEILDGIPAKILNGGALSVVLTDDQLCLFYVHEDKSLHYLAQDLKSGPWKDQILKDSHFDTPITRVIVSPDLETKSFVAAFLTAGALVIVGGSGGRKEMGKVVSDKFVPSTSAEAILVGVIPVYVDYRGQRHGKMISMNNNYWSTVQPRYHTGRRR